VSFLGEKQTGVELTTQSSAEVKERVEIYLYLLWAFISCYKANFIFYLPAYYPPTYYAVIFLFINLSTHPVAHASIHPPILQSQGIADQPV
jgi:hypothetical protein